MEKFAKGVFSPLKTTAERTVAPVKKFILAVGTQLGTNAQTKWGELKKKYVRLPGILSF